MRKGQKASGIGVPQDAMHPACLNREAWPELMHLNVECCYICHCLYPQYDLRWARLESGRVALVCCAVERALSPWPAHPEREAEVQTLFQDTLEGFADE